MAQPKNQKSKVRQYLEFGGSACFLLTSVSCLQVLTSVQVSQLAKIQQKFSFQSLQVSPLLSLTLPLSRFLLRVQRLEPYRICLSCLQSELEKFCKANDFEPEHAARLVLNQGNASGLFFEGAEARKLRQLIDGESKKAAASHPASSSSSSSASHVPVRAGCSCLSARRAF